MQPAVPVFMRIECFAEKKRNSEDLVIPTGAGP